MSVKSKMTAIADPLRRLSGTASAMTLSDMAASAQGASGEMTAQEELLSQIALSLAGKGAGDGESIVLQAKSATPTKAPQIIEPDTDKGFGGLSRVEIDPIPDEYIIPEGTVNITANGEHNVRTAEKVNVNVEAPEAKLYAKAFEPSLTEETYTPESGYDGFSEVTIRQFPVVPLSTPSVSVSAAGKVTATVTQSSTGIVSAGSKTGELQLTTQAGKTVTPTTSEQEVVAAGKYTTGAVKVAPMPTATQATPGITVNSSGLITASATQSAGYVTAGTKQATKQLTTQAGKTVTPTTSEQTAVASGVYTTGIVKVGAIPSKYKDISVVTAEAIDVVAGKTFVNSSGVTTTGTNPYAKEATDTTVDAQADLIAQIASALEGKAGGSGEPVVVSGTFTPTSTNIYANPITISGQPKRPKCVIVATLEQVEKGNLTPSPSQSILFAVKDEGQIDLACLADNSKSYNYLVRVYAGKGLIRITDDGFTLSAPDANTTVVIKTYTYYMVL